MIHKFAMRISFWCGNTLQITEEECLVIQYGMEVLLDGIEKVVILLIAGYLLGYPVEFVAVLSVFCSLRYWAGGTHCKTSFRCLSAMFFMCAASVYGASVLKGIDSTVLYIVMAVALGIILLFAPGQTIRNPIIEESIKRQKKLGAVVWGSLECLIICLTADAYWKWILFIPFLIEVISIVPCWEKKKRAKEEME